MNSAMVGNFAIAGFSITLLAALATLFFCKSRSVRSFIDISKIDHEEAVRLVIKSRTMTASILLASATVFLVIAAVCALK